MGIKNKNIEDFYPLSPMQQGILFHSLADSKSEVYFEQFSWNLKGTLDLKAFRRAWQKIIERHSILRTSFVWEGIKEPVQIVHRQVNLPWQEYDWQHLSPKEQQQKLEFFLQSDRSNRFELKQAPLMRLALIQLSDTSYNFTWSHNHLLLDGWSVASVFKEIFAYYKAFSNERKISLEPIPPYRDYIVWLQQQNLSQAETFWRYTLKGFTTPTQLSVNKGSGLLTKTDDCSKEELKLSMATTAALQSFAKQNQLTLNTLVQGAWALLLSRYSGQEDVVFGAVTSGRPLTLARAESMVGLFINTVPIRVRVSPEEFLLPWLYKIKDFLIEARQYEYCPLFKVQGWSKIPKGFSLFESLVVFENYAIDPSVRQKNINLEIEKFHSFEKTNYPLTLTVHPDEELSLRITVNSSDRFDSNTITRMLGHLQTVLKGMVTDHQQRLRELSILTESEQQQLSVEWNNTEVEYPQEKCIHQLFEEQVEKTPSAIAVVFEDQQLTYAQLNTKANQLAHYLRSRGVKSEVLVGICVERSLEMLIGLLAILKAGGAYIPLDPNYPLERIAFILKETQASVLLTQASLLESLPQHQAQIVCLDTGWHLIAQQSQESLSSQVTTDNLAYLIYTSGSTGKPKGVQISHLALSNFLSSMKVSPGLSPEDTLLAVTTYSFDIAALELFLPIIVGGRLVIASQEIISDGVQLSAKLVNSKATVMQATPATWQLLFATGWNGNPQLKVLCGGEALPAPLANQLIERCNSLWNMYGPTETTIWSAASQVKTFNNTVPISKPIANTQLYILDQYSQLVPVGVAGELCIGGKGLARGYFHRPDLTAEEFIPNPFSEEAARLYKTGDLARHLPNGEIEYIGRIDHQVKVRGFRIELGEIEAAIAQHPEVREAVAVVREDLANSQQIVAYVVPQNEQNLAISALREFLESKLPSYMIPGAFVTLDSLPLTPNGKVDRKALPVPELKQLSSTEIVPASTPIENLLAGIWVKILGLKKVGINHNFFELGGHSLIATRVISQIRQVFEVDLPLRSLFEHPTIAGLAQEIEKASEADLRLEVLPIKRVERETELPLSFAQQRLWLLAQLEPDNPSYNINEALGLQGKLDILALIQTLEAIIQRHEVLRTNFTTVAGKPVQVIHPEINFQLSKIDLSSLSKLEQEREVSKLTENETITSFDLKRDSLLRATLIKLNDLEHIILFTMHHIISDGWSIGILVTEVATLYRAFLKGKPSSLPELPIQYADYAVWQREWLQGEVLERQLKYWKQKLGGKLPILKLPYKQPKPVVKTNRSLSHNFKLSQELTLALKQLSSQTNTTLFMVILATLKTLLYRYTKQEDIVVGTDIANRNRAETEGLIGFFVNLLVIRTDLSGYPSFKELLNRVREVTLSAYAHQDLPFDRLVRELQPSRQLDRTPLFQVLLVMNNVPTLELQLPNLTITSVEKIDNYAKFELVLFIAETKAGIVGNWQYNSDLFNAETINRLSKNYVTLLQNIVSQPNTRINNIAMITQAEKEQQTTAEVNQEKSKFNKFLKVKPKASNLPSSKKLIKSTFLRSKETLPLVITPAIKNLNIFDWVKNERKFLENKLLKYGAILFRDCQINSINDFENLAQSICPNLFGNYGDLPRTGVSDKVYGSTPYPADKTILFHNESSHLHSYPQKIWFFCVHPAQEGGETPIVDCRQVYQLLDPEVREKLERKQLTYVRNYTKGLDVSWQDFFHTEDKSVVEAYCIKSEIEFEWLSDNGLRTRKKRPAIAQHPITDEKIFFNQIQLHHVAYLDSKLRESLLSVFDTENLPRNVYYGDASPLKLEDIKAINQAYQEATISFPWQKGDVLMLDNLLTAHSRNPYKGERKIVVAMGDTINSSNK